MKRILGLDLGTNSIGWALVEQDFEAEAKSCKILGLGSRIIPMGTDKQDYEKGAGITKNATRREKRTSRKMSKRYKLRRNKLLFILNKLNMLPDQFQFKNGLPEPTKLQELELLPIKRNRDYDENGKRKDRKYKDGQKIKEEPMSLLNCKLRVNALREKIELKDFGKILFQFNQLRGYSGGNNNEDTKKKQKREDENDNDTKKKIYEVITQKVEILNVKKSDETFTVRGGKNKGEKQNKYDVIILLDEKEVEGQTELQNLEEKIGQEEELEIRIKRTKTGETITFALPQKSNWRKAMEADEKILKDEDIFISELRLKDLNQSKWTKIRNRVFLRNRYKEEFDKVWDTQVAHYQELNNCRKETLEEIANYIFPGKSESQQQLRKQAINNGLKYIVKEQVIYYQRPLKPQTELISNCRFEKEEKVIATSHPLFQEFRCWKQINNLYITSKQEVYSKKKQKNILQRTDQYLTNEQKQKIYDKLQIQKQVGFNDIKKIVGIKDDKIEYLNGLNIKAKLMGCDTLIAIKKSLDKNYDVIFSKDDTIIEQLWKVIFDTHEGSEYDAASKRVTSIIDVLEKHTDKETATELALKLAQSIKFPRKYASLSAKAIQNILPLMRLCPQNILEQEQVKTKFENIKHLIETGEIIDNVDYNLEDYVIDFVRNNPDILEKGGLMEYLAISLIYKKHTAETIKAQVNNYHDIKYEQRNLRNPIVEQLLNEAMQVVKAIWKQYKFNPENLEIRIELARDLKNSAQERGKIYKGQLKNQKINDNAKERLNEHNIALTDYNILKYRLYEQQKHISPYTGKPIEISKLFNDKEYDIDHILPKARYYDDSFSNKVVSEKNINEEKSNRTALEYITQQNSQFNILSVENYLNFINNNFFGKKKKNLLAEKIPTNPIERQLKDTQYISIAVKNELAKIVGSENVKTSTGEVTDFLRSRWGLKKLFMELTENRFKQMEFWDLDENDNPKTEWVERYVDENGKNIYKIKNWSKRYDHRHHAIDALVVALTEQSHIQRLNNLNKYVQEELEKQKDKFKIEPKEDETILDAFFNLEEKRRKEILHMMESSRKFEMPFSDLVKQVREHLESMVVSHKPKDKLGIKIDEKTNKKQLKIRSALHEATYYGKLNEKDTKIIDISNLKAKDIGKIIDQDVLAKEIDTHRKKYDSMKEAFTGEGLKLFNESRFQRKEPTKLKPPVYKVKVWYNTKETTESSLQQLYNNNKKQSVITGDNYMFLVMEKISPTKTERIFDIVSLYNSAIIAKKSLKNNRIDIKQQIINKAIFDIKNDFIKELQEKITTAKNKTKLELEQELLNWTNEKIQIKPLFTLQQNELVYLPTDLEDSALRMSNGEFEEWIKDKENKKAFCKRIYKVVKFTGKDCFFIPHNYAKTISVAKDLTEEEIKMMKKLYDGKKIPKHEKNYEEFGSYGTCAKTEVNTNFIKELVLKKNFNEHSPLKIQDTCIKIQIDWIGNIKLIEARKYQNE
jgi:CRISPR/Cas system Type II protein with McrA/HNH and RuvC-like nuclease domain